MRRRPKGRKKYRNLCAYGSSIYYERVEHGRRIRISLRTDDWDIAAQLRDDFEARARNRRRVAKAPTFGELAKRYLEHGAVHLAPSTAEDRKFLLSEKGLVTRALGPTTTTAISGTSARWRASWDTPRRA